MTTTTDTIRLSDRLELRADAERHLIRTLILDGEHAGIVYASAESALVALANPPRYDLPPGVIAGSDGKFYAPGDVVRTLPDEMWTAHFASGSKAFILNLSAVRSQFYEVRPTAANLLQPLPAYTFRLPDGELACYRHDAAKLREAGATLRTMTGGMTFAKYDDLGRHAEILLVEFPAPPKTERVPWWEALRDQRKVAFPNPRSGDDNAVTYAVAWSAVNVDGFVGLQCNGKDACPPNDDGTVEVLATDGAL